MAVRRGLRAARDADGAEGAGMGPAPARDQRDRRALRGSSPASGLRAPGVVPSGRAGDAAVHPGTDPDHS